MASKRTKPAADEVDICIVSGVEGPSIYINELRVAGPKPWGGGTTICEFRTKRANIDEALAQVWQGGAHGCYVRPSREGAGAKE